MNESATGRSMRVRHVWAILSLHLTWAFLAGATGSLLTACATSRGFGEFAEFRAHTTEDAPPGPPCSSFRESKAHAYR